MGEFHLLAAAGAVGAQEGFHLGLPEGAALGVGAQAVRDLLQRGVRDERHDAGAGLGGLGDLPDLLGGGDGPQAGHVGLQAVLEVGALGPEPLAAQFGQDAVEAEGVDVVRHVADVGVVEEVEVAGEFGVQFAAAHAGEVQPPGPVELVEAAGDHLLGAVLHGQHLGGRGAHPVQGGQQVLQAAGEGAEGVLVGGEIRLLADEAAGEVPLVAGGQALAEQVGGVGDVEVDVALEVAHVQADVAGVADAEGGGAVAVDVLLVVAGEAEAEGDIRPTKISPMSMRDHRVPLRTGSGWGET